MASLTIEAVSQQEQKYRLKHLTFEDAWQIGVFIRNKAQVEHLPVAIEVWAFGQPLFFSALSGSVIDNIEWMKRKRNTVLRTGHSSLFMGLTYAQAGQPMENKSYIDQAEYCDHGGSFPILHESGAVLGAVTLSGLPSEQDHILAISGLQHLLDARDAIL
ncbi:heme-degrading domain-containing protein [Rosenbergiella epipactidis]|uniref:heme-degrading domain-containing protein n=1 Tax=Rosenbergiella epipactidis TaxID=1544694 RepID=UPI001BDAD133|nr:heme-degrading domain-containing protein [Rosenbergiella epipactidis]MBT0718970.1 heme-degrading domain-containing protein [Rosenbergiella epipactidis]